MTPRRLSVRGRAKYFVPGTLKLARNSVMFGLAAMYGTSTPSVVAAGAVSTSVQVAGTAMTMWAVSSITGTHPSGIGIVGGTVATSAAAMNEIMASSWR